MNKNLLIGLALFPAGNLMAQTEKPNVLIIHTDEHNFRTLGCYRALLPQAQAEVWGKDVVVETPNIDFLAHNGVLCNRFYATSPVSSPSRSSFMTGLYTMQTEVVTNNIPMDKKATTFAMDMEKAGYHTGYIGKWHLNGPMKPGWEPADKFGFQDNRFMLNRGHYKRIEGEYGHYEISYKGGKGLGEDNFFTDFLTEKTIDYIREHKNEPFCCVLAFPDPHGPNLVRPPYDTMYKNMKFQMPATAAKNKNGLPSWAYANHKLENMAGYFGMIKCIDDKIGLVIDELKKQDLLDKTIIIFTSDHGDLCGEHGRTNKGVPLEASAKVPMIVYYPAALPKGHVVEEVLSVVDFAPTLLSLTNVKSDAPRAGRDFSALLKGEEAPGEWRDAIFMRGTDNADGSNDDNWVSVVSKDYKLTLSSKTGDQPWLTDMKKDPDELVNEYNNPKYAKVVKALLHQLKEYGTTWKDHRITDAPIAKELEKQNIK